MVSSEEKKKFVEDLIEMSKQKGQSLETQYQLHKLLLMDTNQGKLYKYRTFDNNGYSLKNLYEGTLHCSKAEVFNDPFDSKIGVTYQSLFEAKYETEFDVVSEILESYFYVFRGIKLMDEISSDEQQIIKKLLSNNVLSNFFTSIDHNTETQEEVTKQLMNNAFVIGELMKIVLSDEKFKGILGLCADFMPKIIDRISQEGILLLTNENASLEDYARVNGVMEDTDEIGLTTLLSEKLYPELNKEFVEVQRIINDRNHEIADKINNLILLGCLCTDYKNRLMWSHYAESHKGFCIEYDFSGTDEEILSKLPLPVLYSENRPLVPWKVAIENSEKNLEEANVELMRGLLTKDKIWEYENEWRFLNLVTEGPELKMPPITCIYLGAAIEKENYSKIIEMAKLQNIQVRQMKVDRGEYKLHSEIVLQIKG